jgi:hypothetical protein
MFFFKLTLTHGNQNDAGQTSINHDKEMVLGRVTGNDEILAPSRLLSPRNMLSMSAISVA